MSPLQTARELGGNVIGSLKNEPVLLVLIILNAAFLGFGFWNQQGEREVNKVLVEELVRSNSAERDRWKELVENAMRWCPAVPKQ